MVLDVLGQFIIRCSESYIRFQFLGHGFKVHLLPDLLVAVLGVFVVSKIMTLLNGLRVCVHVSGMQRSLG
jgi:extradiol dioxygenase family protein